MTRRVLALMMIPDPPVEQTKFPPTDAKKLNEFAICWNEYVAQLTEGKVNYKMWRAVIHAWGDLTR